MKIKEIKIKMVFKNDLPSKRKENWLMDKNTCKHNHRIDENQNKKSDSSINYHK